MDATHRPRRGRVVASVLVTVLVLALGATVGYGAYLRHLVDGGVTHQDLLPAPAAAGVTASPPRRAEAGDALNVLIIGSDERPGESRGRSDVMVIAHVDRERSAVTLVHLPRDMQVAIPGRGTDKLNAAYAYGGSPLLVQAVQALLGVRIDHVAQMGFEGFKAMTDAVGGVDVDVAEASPGFPQGQAHLDGARALEFVRERYHLPEGDISRGRREQAFIKGLLMKASSAETVRDPRAVAGFIDAAARHATVDRDLTTDRIQSLALELRSLRAGDIRFVTAPISGFATRPDGASIDVVDAPAMARLGQALARDEMDGYRG